MKITRRKLAALAAAAVAAPTQTVVAQQPAGGEDLMKFKRDQMQANATALAAVKIPTAVEPAFQFKA